MENGRRRGLTIGGLLFLSPREALQEAEAGAVLVDLRSEELAGMKAFRVPELVHLPHADLPARLGELPKDRLLVLADSSGVYTKGAAAVLRAAGFERIACLNGGMLAWDQEGLPLATDPDALLQGECACIMQSRKKPLPS